jgi:hypothetical protein
MHLRRKERNPPLRNVAKAEALLAMTTIQTIQTVDHVAETELASSAWFQRRLEHEVKTWMRLAPSARISRQLAREAETEMIQA